jgi:hypothetical protein
MSGHIVFVRFFLDFTPDFPSHRFDRLNGDAFRDAFDTVAKEWLSKPENRKHFRMYRSKEEKRRIERNDLRRSWIQFTGMDSKSLAEIMLPKPRRVPDFWEIAEAADWTCPKGFETTYGVSDRYPVNRYESKEDADLAAAALNERLGELSRATYEKGDWDNDDIWSASNPRYFVVAESELSRVELVTAREKLQRIRDTAVGNVSLEEAFLRLFWPFSLPTLEQIDELAQSEARSNGRPVSDQSADEGEQSWLSDTDLYLLGILANAQEPLQARALSSKAGCSEAYVRQRISGVKGRKGLKAKGLVEAIPPNRGYQITATGRTRLATVNRSNSSDQS